MVGQYAAFPLRKRILEDYDRRVRPVRDQSTTVTLDVDVALRQVVGLKFGDRTSSSSTSEYKDPVTTLPRPPADQGWLKPLSHIQNLPPNTSRPRLAEAPVTHSEPSPEHQPTKNLPPNTSRPRLAEAPVTHSEPSPEHQPTKNLPPNTSRPRLAEAAVTHIQNLPPNTSRPRLAEAPVTHSEPSPEHQPTKNLPPNTSRPRLAEAPVTHSEPSPEHQPTKGSGNLLPVTDVSVSSEGRVAWRQPGLFQSTCAVDVSQFPYDEQTCVLEFSSWLYGGNDLNLRNVSATMDLTAFQQNDQFEVTHTKVERKHQGQGRVPVYGWCSAPRTGQLAHVWMVFSTKDRSVSPCVDGVQHQGQLTYYDCCPGPWPSIELHIHLKRRRLFYIVNMVIPCLDLLMLNLAAFYIPPDSGERLGFTITLLLSLVVFQQLLTTQLPATSTSTPMLGKFFTATIVLVTVSLLITILVLRLSHPAHPSRPLPRWLRLLLLNYTASFFCMCNIAKDQSTPRNSTKNDWSGDDTEMKDLFLDSRHQNDPKNRPILQEISSKVEEITAYLRDKVDGEAEEGEWKMAALVLDRAAMWATAVASVTISLVFLL
ncbi:Neuronal acetylcholine receptor subunit beta-4 [Branchiostoma belcheri]|nr:Neuronal acetylcholine receptor subunit beta-4 [Branchiostoma belcheri]